MLLVRHSLPPTAPTTPARSYSRSLTVTVLIEIGVNLPVRRLRRICVICPDSITPPMVIPAHREIRRRAKTLSLSSADPLRQAKRTKRTAHIASRRLIPATGNRLIGSWLNRLICLSIAPTPPPPRKSYRNRRRTVVAHITAMRLEVKMWRRAEAHLPTLREWLARRDSLAHVDPSRVGAKVHIFHPSHAVDTEEHERVPCKHGGHVWAAGAVGAAECMYCTIHHRKHRRPDRRVQIDRVVSARMRKVREPTCRCL